MLQNVISTRPFIGAKDFDISRKFYQDFGFEETKIGENMSVFQTGSFSFYLQNAYVKDWIDNTMLFLEVENVEAFWENLLKLGLPVSYESVRISPVQNLDWGKECFIHDPSGILWHVGEFNT